MIRLVLPLAVFAMSGCAPQPAPATQTSGIECDSNKVAGLIGKTRSAEVEAEAKRMSGANTVRWIAPDMMVTQDYRVDRLNLHTGTDGTIGSARCG